MDRQSMRDRQTEDNRQTEQNTQTDRQTDDKYIDKQTETERWMDRA